jgi:Cd2+/Zn2+-exporting ATPase
VDEFSKVYTPVVVLVAICMCTIPWAFGADVGKEWTYNGLVLMVVACPCAVIISTPVTYVAGLAATSQRGILIKGGAHLEALGLVKTICFDKTGTLTQGSFALLSVNVIGEDYTRKEVMEYLCLMEERANHPLALAIVDGARNEGIVSPKNKVVKNHTFLAGEGLKGEIDGKEIMVGNERLFKRLGLLDNLPEELENMVYNWEAMAGTVGFMSIEGSGLVCAYCVADAVRHESLEVVDTLHELGISVNMFTGDNKDTARAIGCLVGLKPEGIKGELLPEEKLNLIKSLKSEEVKGSILSNPLSKRQLVMMVGGK